MEDLKYININGKLVSSDSFVLKGSNRSFLYGDGIFETMHANGSEIQFVENHYNRLIASAEKLKYELFSDFTVSMIIRETERMFHKNRYFKGARVRLNLFRNEGGLYTPENNSVSFIIQASALNEERYVLNKKGLSVGVYEDDKKPRNLFCNLKSSNSLLYVLGGLYKKEKGLDDVLIINDLGDIIESLSSNIFLLNSGKIITPDLESGPVAGIMRNIVIYIARELKYEVEFKTITEELLFSSDEVFLTNAVKGIQWVSGYKSKRYFNQLSTQILKELNRIAYD